MAHILVERARTIPWWGWMIGLTIAFAAIWLMLLTGLRLAGPDATANPSSGTEPAVAERAATTPPA